MNPVWVGTRVAKMPYEKLEELCAMDEKDLKVSMNFFFFFFVMKTIWSKFNILVFKSNRPKYFDVINY